MPVDNVKPFVVPVTGTKLPPPPSKLSPPPPERVTSDPAVDFGKQVKRLAEAKYDKDTAMAEAALIMQQAAQVGQYSAALGAAKLRAEISGLLIQRKEIGRAGEFRGISDEELSTLITEDLKRIGVSEEAAATLALAALDEV